MASPTPRPVSWPEMNPDEKIENLTDCPPTNWGLVNEALRPTDGGDPGRRRQALDVLLKAYERPIRSYLAGALHDPEAVNDAFQNLAARMIAGGFARVDPAKGKFRNYLKTALCRLATDIRRKRIDHSLDLEGVAAPYSDDPEIELESDREFLQHWTRGLLDIAWEGLSRDERSAPNQPYFTALSHKCIHRERDNTKLAEVLGRKLGREITRNRAAQVLFEARARFSTYIYDAVASTLSQPTRNGIEEELIALGLHRYVVSRVRI